MNVKALVVRALHKLVMLLRTNQCNFSHFHVAVSHCDISNLFWCFVFSYWLWYITIWSVLLDVMYHNRHSHIGNGIKITPSAVLKSSSLLWFAISISNSCVMSWKLVIFTFLWLWWIRGPLVSVGLNSMPDADQVCYSCRYKNWNLLDDLIISNSGRSHTWPDLGFVFPFHMKSQTFFRLKPFQKQTMPVIKGLWSSVWTTPDMCI